MSEDTTYSTTRLKEFMEKNSLGAMDIVRMCNISVATAYKIKSGEPVGSLDTIYKTYMGLKNSGFQVTWEELTGIK